MGDRTQLGVKVDADLWREFRNDVEDRKGQVRGVLGDELENAIRQYLYTGENQSPAEIMSEMNDRLQRVEQRVGSSQPDGGAPTHFSDSSNTHTRDTFATTGERTEHLAQLAQNELDFDEIPTDRLEEIIKDEFGFGERTVGKYVDKVVDELGGERIGNGQVIKWGETLQEHKAKAEEIRRIEANETMAQADAATAGSEQ